LLICARLCGILTEVIPFAVTLQFAENAPFVIVMVPELAWSEVIQILILPFDPEGI
jgi:hypothetical protein